MKCIRIFIQASSRFRLSDEHMWTRRARLFTLDENLRRCGFGHLLRRGLCGQFALMVDWLGQ